MSRCAVVVCAVVAVSFMAATAVAQVSGWAHTWGGANSDDGMSVAVRPSGDVVLVGNTASSGSGDYDWLLVKYEADGTLKWARSYDVGFGASNADITAGPTGELIVAGGTNDNSDALIAKFNGDGDLAWARYLTNSWEDFGGAVVDDAGDIYATGQTIIGSIDAHLSKYDGNGTRLWTRVWDRQQNDAGAGITRDQTGNIYVTGNSGDWAAAGNQDVFLLKFDANGNLLWDRVWSVAREFGLNVMTTADGSVYVSGFISGYGAGDDDVLLLKFDTNGSFLWARTWGGTGVDVGSALVYGTDGTIYVAGTTTSNLAPGDRDVLLLQFSANGDILSSRTWHGPGAESGGDIAVSPTGSLYIAGTAPNASGTWNDVTGTVGTPVGTVTPGPGVVTPFNPTDVIPTVTETTFPGTADIGGGGSDALLLGLNCLKVILETCPFAPSDVNCDGINDVRDVVEAVNIAFRGGVPGSPCCRYR